LRWLSADAATHDARATTNKPTKAIAEIRDMAVGGNRKSVAISARGLARQRSSRSSSDEQGKKQMTF